MIKKYISYIIVALIFGFVSAKQINLKSGINSFTSQKTINQVSTQIEEGIKSNAKLRDEHASLEQQRTALEKAVLSKSQKDQTLNDELTKLQIITSKTKVEGPGIIITFESDLQETQLIDLVNAIKNISADAIAINEDRIVGNTPLTDKYFQKPVFKIIGNSEILKSSLERSGGILDQISLNPDIVMHDKIEISAVSE